LDVVYPEGSDAPGWEPPGWTPDRLELADGSVEVLPFRWPVGRRYLDQTAAKERAELLRTYGAKVEVVRSNRVSWPDDEDAGQQGLVSFVARHADGPVVVEYVSERGPALVVWVQRGGDRQTVEARDLFPALRRAARTAARLARRGPPPEARWGRRRPGQPGFRSGRRQEAS
jgi:hypothetical protein